MLNVNPELPPETAASMLPLLDPVAGLISVPVTVIVIPAQGLGVPPPPPPPLLQE